MSLWGLGTRLCAQVGGCRPSWHNHASSHGWEGPGTRLVDCTSQDCAGAAEPRFPLPAPVHTSLPSAGMHHFRIRLRHPRNVPCFPWCVLWERRGNSHPRCRPHTWVAAGVDKPPCQLCPWSSGALAVQCHLPGKVAWGVLGAEIKERGVCKGWVPVFLSTHLS